MSKVKQVEFDRISFCGCTCFLSWCRRAEPERQICLWPIRSQAQTPMQANGMPQGWHNMGCVVVVYMRVGCCCLALCLKIKRQALLSLKETPSLPSCRARSRRTASHIIQIRRALGPKKDKPPPCHTLTTTDINLSHPLPFISFQVGCTTLLLLRGGRGPCGGSSRQQQHHHHHPHQQQHSQTHQDHHHHTPRRHGQEGGILTRLLVCASPCLLRGGLLSHCSSRPPP
jgi:ABC-type nickel/cobalt efflux system permease component RcnA